MHKSTLMVAGLVVASALADAGTAGGTTLYAFKGGTTDGCNPAAGVFHIGPNLVGTTQGCGAHAFGTVFKVAMKTGHETFLYSFQGEGKGDGNDPTADLIKGLYGTTYTGGANQSGTVFKFNNRTNVETPLYSFGDSGASDGGGPSAGLININGTLWGTTFDGGTFGHGGTVFSLTLRHHVENVWHSFNYRDQTGGGGYPTSALVAVGNTLYGTTGAGGAHNCGTIFSVDSTTGATTDPVYTFQGEADSCTPNAGMINVGNVLYGTTSQGGMEGGGGAIFSFDPASGHEKVVYPFCSDYESGQCLDGALPLAGLLAVTIDNVTTLYGTTTEGGTYNTTNCNSGCGVVFSYNISTGAEQTLYLFQGGSDGKLPVSDLIYANGLLYGTTPQGGDPSCNCGTVFEVAP